MSHVSFVDNNQKVVTDNYLGDGWVGGAGRDEGDGGGGGVVGDHRLLDLLLHVGDVPQGPHGAHTLQHGRQCQSQPTLVRQENSLVKRY